MPKRTWSPDDPLERLLLSFAVWGGNERRWSSNTKDAYTITARALARVLGGADVLTSVEAPELKRAFFQLSDHPATRSRYRAALVAFFDFCISEGLRSDNPAHALPRGRRKRGLPRPIESSLVKRYLDAARALGPRHEAVAALGVFAGLRISEAASLAWTDCDTDALRITGKGGHERRVPLAEPLRDALTAWRAHVPADTWVFEVLWSGTRRPVRRQTLQIWHHQICAEAGVPHLVFHQLRHSFATEALRVSGNLRAVQELLGHSSPTTTAIYTLVTPGTLETVVSAMFVQPGSSAHRTRRRRASFDARTLVSLLRALQRALGSEGPA